MAEAALLLTCAGQGVVLRLFHQGEQIEPQETQRENLSLRVFQTLCGHTPLRTGN
jgi:hypothetical protein